MLRKQRLHLRDQIGFAARELRLALPPQIFFAILDLGEACARDQILDLDFTARFFIRALNDRAR